MEAKDINKKTNENRQACVDKKTMREQRPNISHQFDIRHVCKSIRKKF